MTNRDLRTIIEDIVAASEWNLLDNDLSLTEKSARRDRLIDGAVNEITDLTHSNYEVPQPTNSKFVFDKQRIENQYWPEFIDYLKDTLRSVDGDYATPAFWHWISSYKLPACNMKWEDL